MGQVNQNFTGQTFNNQAVYINGEVTTNPQIAIARSPFLLERYDFDKIVNTKGVLNGIATTLLGATLGLFINMVAKFIGNKIDSTIKFDNWEIYSFLLTLLLMGAFYSIDYFVPN
jgi:hypothetical protein